MTSRMATPKDYPALDALYAAGLVTTRLTWPLPIASSTPPDWSDYRVPISEDAQGIRFGYAVRSNPRDVKANLPAHGAIHVDEEAWFIGPRTGLSAKLTLTANLEVLRAWVNDCKTRGLPGTFTIYGVAPTTWGANGLYSTTLASSIVSLVDGEWYLPGAWTLIFGTVAQWDSALAAKGVL